MTKFEKEKFGNWEDELWYKVNYCVENDGEVNETCWENSVISFIKILLKDQRERITQVLKSKLDRKDNPVLDAGLLYALTVLEK